MVEYTKCCSLTQQFTCFALCNSGFEYSEWVLVTDEQDQESIVNHTGVGLS